MSKTVKKFNKLIVLNRKEFLKFCKNKTLWSKTFFGKFLKENKRRIYEKNPFFYMCYLVPNSIKVKTDKYYTVIDNFYKKFKNDFSFATHEIKGKIWKVSFNWKNKLYYLKEIEK